MASYKTTHFQLYFNRKMLTNNDPPKSARRGAARMARAPFGQADGVQCARGLRGHRAIRGQGEKIKSPTELSTREMKKSEMKNESNYINDKDFLKYLL